MNIASRATAAVLVSAFLLMACSEEVPPNAEQAYEEAQLIAEPPPPNLQAEGSLVATATVPQVRAYRSPEDEKPFARFVHPGSFGTPRVFLVRQDRGKWLRALLPMEPNGSEGWIRARDVEIAMTPMSVEIDTGGLWLKVYRGSEQVLRSRAAVGTAATPTPTGLFFTTILARPTSPESPYGKFAYGLSGYSEVLTTFAGGDGQIAIHGTNQPSLIGTPVSHGCIRVDNQTITKLAHLLPLGTPVRIHD